MKYPIILLNLTKYSKINSNSSNYMEEIMFYKITQTISIYTQMVLKCWSELGAHYTWQRNNAEKIAR